MRFQDREHAGRLLASRLEYLRDAQPIVLGLTRGGIPVAFEVARRLGAPLDLIVVRKVQAAAPQEPCIGAIAEGGVSYLNPTYEHEGRLRAEAAERAEEAVIDLTTRIRLYRGDVPAPRLMGRTVVVVDDFVATGTTARAAARAARRRGASSVVLAVPVLPANVEVELAAEYDEVMSLAVTSPSTAPSDAYERSEQVSDEQAIALLRRARAERLGGTSAPAVTT
jgi:putative phosphoribosyl transferase